jgi:hypothetical protein
MTAEDHAVAKQYARYQEADAAARRLWDKKDREERKLVRMAKIGRKASKVVPISDSRGLQILNSFRGEVKVFAPAFARKWKIKEVPLDND